MRVEEAPIPRSNDTTLESENGEEKQWEFSHFDPPLYKQRYEAVLEILSDKKWVRAIARVVDFGCA